MRVSAVRRGLLKQVLAEKKFVPSIAYYYEGYDKEVNSKGSSTRLAFTSVQPLYYIEFECLVNSVERPQFEQPMV